MFVTLRKENEKILALKYSRCIEAAAINPFMLSEHVLALALKINVPEIT
jgi:hypothetical protein